MKKINIFLLSLIVLVFAFILYSSREIFFFHYDAEYFENLYYHSQYNIPQSSRGISDGELYKFVGYQLVKGENPFYLNYEVPPFGKYLFGLAEVTVGNPYWVSLGFFILSAVVIYFFSRELFKKNLTISLLSVLLFVSTPYVATQIKETMLDLPLMFLFFTGSWFMVRFLKRRSFKDLIFAGIFLGLATGTKIGVYTPLAVLLGMVLSFIGRKKIISPLVYLVSTFTGYVISFFSYFIRHPNPLPWLRLHEKPLQFYLGSIGHPDYLSQWKGIFLNTYKGFWVGAASTGLGDWSLLLPIGVIFAIAVFIYAVRKRDLVWTYLSSFSFVFLIVNTFLSFWARYLMPVIPLFILIIIFVLKKHTRLLLLLVALNLLILIPTLTTRNLPGHTEAVSRFLNYRAYRELYRSIDSETRSKYPEEKFQTTLENFYETVKVKKISISISDVYDKGSVHTAKLDTKYVTDFGVLTDSENLSFTREHNQWKLLWKWDYLYAGYDPEGEIIVKDGPPVASHLTKLGQIVATYRDWKAIYVIPRLMSDWGKYLFSLSTLTAKGDHEVDLQVRSVIPDKYKRYVGILDPSLDPDTIKKNILAGIYLVDEPYLVNSGINTGNRELFRDILTFNQKHPEYFYQTGTVRFVKKTGETYDLPFQRLDKEDLTVVLDLLH